MIPLAPETACPTRARLKKRNRNFPGLCPRMLRGLPLQPTWLLRPRGAFRDSNNRLTNLRPAIRNAVAAAHYQQSEPGNLDVAAPSSENSLGHSGSELCGPHSRPPEPSPSGNIRGFWESLPRQGTRLRPPLEQRPRHRKVERALLRQRSRVSDWGIQRLETADTAELSITAPPKAFSYALGTRRRQPHAYGDRPIWGDCNIRRTEKELLLLISK